MASTIRHDVPEEQYVQYGDGMTLVGGVSNGFAMGSGVVIDREWVLTAAHVVSPMSEFGLSFETDPDPNEVPDDEWGLLVSGWFSVTEAYTHPFYDDELGPAGGFDIALLHLDRPCEQYTPWNRVQGNASGNPELGKQGTAVGFGTTGTGLTGFDPATGLTRLAGDNMIDGLGSDPRVISEFVARDIFDPETGETVHFTQEQIANQFLLSDFDAPIAGYANPLGSATPLAMEASVAPGDSGGPLFIEMEDGLVVAGINSWILGLPSPDGDGTDNASYGDIAGYLRVSAFNDWIDEVIGVPEPATLGLLSLGAVGLLRRRR